MKYLRYEDELQAIAKKPKDEQAVLLGAEKLWVCDRCGDVVDAGKNNWDYDMYTTPYCLCPYCLTKVEDFIYGPNHRLGDHRRKRYEDVNGEWVEFKGNNWDYENIQNKIAEELEKISGVNKELLGPK